MVPSITNVISHAPSSLGGWFGYMAAGAVAKDPRLAASLGNPSQLRAVVQEASKAADRYRDQAAQRGTRVHYYCEQVALRALGAPNDALAARAALAQNGEEQFACRFDEWWELYQVRPIAPEITVWNKELGYAGTLDLVATIGGRLCLIDFKTKNTDRDGQVKAMDDKVVMQLVAGMKAEESLVNAQTGQWEPWKYGQDPMLLGVAIGQTEVRAMRANPEVLKHHWFKFCALRRAWETGLNAAGAGQALLPIGPPPASAPPTSAQSPSGQSVSVATASSPGASAPTASAMQGR